MCRRIRAKSQVPIIVLSARGAEADKVNALDLGADDYVTKPFGPEELLARIRVALRRVASEDSRRDRRCFAPATLTIDYDRRRVVRDGPEIRLTPKEFDLLSLLARNHDRVLTHRAILKADLGPERGGAAGAPVDAGRAAAEEDRAGPGASRSTSSASRGWDTGS